MSVGIIRNVIKSSDLPTSIHTFADVQKVLNAHAELERLSVGMEMDEVTVGSEPMVWLIGNISSGEVIFVPKWCLSTTRQMNGTTSNVGGWNSSVLRAWLNGDFYNSLPDTVKPYIKSRTFKTSAGNQSTSLQSATDKIWLPREYEVFGLTNYSASAEYIDGNAEQFSYFETLTNRIKTMGKNGTTWHWWESSPSTENNKEFCICQRTGDIANEYQATEYAGVLPCFRMTPDGGGVELVDINPNQLTNSGWTNGGFGWQPFVSDSGSGLVNTIIVAGYKKISMRGNGNVTTKYRFRMSDDTTSEWVSVSMSNAWTSYIDIPNDAIQLELNILGPAQTFLMGYISLLA